MPKRNQRQNRKNSYNDNHKRQKYQEKPIGEWKCGVCEQVYTEKQEYCLSCYQELYYYCYVNNSLFVTKDDSYLEIYYHQHALPQIEHSDSEHSSFQDSEEDVDLNWVQTLIM